MTTHTCPKCNGFGWSLKASGLFGRDTCSHCQGTGRVRVLHHLDRRELRAINQEETA